MTNFDPDANLAQIRKILKRYPQVNGFGNFDGESLAEYVMSLDDHLSRGGALPAAWQRKIEKIEELIELPVGSVIWAKFPAGTMEKFSHGSGFAWAQAGNHVMFREDRVPLPARLLRLGRPGEEDFDG